MYFPGTLNLKFISRYKPDFMAGLQYYNTQNHDTMQATTPENKFSGFPTRSDTNRPVQSQKQARSLKFRFKNKSNCSIHVAKTKALISFTDLHLCFRTGKNRFSQDAAHYTTYYTPTLSRENLLFCHLTLNSLSSYVCIFFSCKKN